MESIKSFTDEWANIAEFLGLLLTLVSFVKILLFNRELKKLDKKHLFRHRSTETIKTLKEISENISRDLADFENKKTILRLEVEKSKQIIKSLIGKLSHLDVTSLQVLVNLGNKLSKKSINASNSPIINWVKAILNRSPLTEIDIGNYYIVLNGVITSLEEIKKDSEATLLP